MNMPGTTDRRIFSRLARVLGGKSVGVNLAGVPRNSGNRRGFRSAFYRARHFWWYLTLHRNIWMSELGAVVPRIRIRLDKKLDEHGVPLGTLWCDHPNGLLSLNTRAQDRIRDMQ